MDARERLEIRLRNLPPVIAESGLADLDEVVAERDEVIIRWMFKKAAEYRTTRGKQHTVKAETVEMLADKLRRGAARPNNLRMPAAVLVPEAGVLAQARQLLAEADRPGLTSLENDLCVVLVRLLSPVSQPETTSDAELCQCCDFGNHTEHCDCDGTRCCHPERHTAPEAEPGALTTT